MPSDVSIRRFKGLTTDTPSSEGEIDELILAENVMFDRYGQMEARPGFHFYANALLGDTSMYFMGKTGISGNLTLLAGDKAYYFLDSQNRKPTPNIPKTAVLNVVTGSRTSNVVTLELNTPNGHPLGTGLGDQVIVDVEDNSYDGQFTVTTVLTGPHRIQYNQIGPNDGAAGNGFVTVVPRSYIRGVQYNNKLYLPDGRLYDTLLDVFNRAPGFPVSTGGTILVHAERMWFIDANARLRFSDPGNPESWPAANFIDINPGDAVRTTDLYSFQNRLYIFKEYGIWVLDTPGPPTTWFLRRFTDIGGAVRSAGEYDGVMYWLASNGAYKFDGSDISRVSDPIQNIFDESEETVFVISLDSFDKPPVFRDQWIVGLYIGGEFRCFCYNVKIGVWSEWTFPYFLESTEVLPPVGEGEFFDGPTSVWVDGGKVNIDSTPALFMTIRDTDRHSMLVGTELNDNSWIDQTGSRVGITEIIDHEYFVKFQTKYSSFGDPYQKKRCLDWILENEGGDVLVEQVDDRQELVEKTISGGSDLGVVHQNKFKGIGYFRKLSLRFTVTNFKDAGFRFFGVYGRMRERGKLITDREQIMK